MKRISVNLLMLSIFTFLLSGCWEAANSVNNQTSSYNAGFSPYVDRQGNIRRPDDFRKGWVHLGSWFVSSDGMNSGASIHDVYATPESVKDFIENGQWQDGATLVKTVSSINEKQLTTGNAKWANTIDVWFVMVRDRENRFPNNKAWGEGWGWALFQSDAPNKNLTISWKGEGFNNCFGCHAPVQNTEWVYINGYPTVRNSQKYSK